MLVGYARVSTREQETRLQLDALRAAGVRRVFEEKASGAALDRPVLRECLSSLRKGDVLVVWKVDRVARSLKHLLALLEHLDSVGARIKSLNEPLDTSTPLGMYLIQSLGSIAQLERSMIRERVIAGQVAAIIRGQRHGRPPLLSDQSASEVWAAWQAGDKNKARLARAFGVQRHVIDRVIRLRLNPADSRYGPRRPVLGPLLEAVR